MLNSSKGFTLIELMIVVAILGILSATAIALYRDFVPRSQLTRVVGEISSFKTGFEERLVQMGSVTNQDLGYNPSKLTTGNVGTDIATMQADGSGELRVKMGGDSHPSVSGAVIILTRSASGIWECLVDPGSAGDWKERYLPPGCSEI